MSEEKRSMQTGVQQIMLGTVTGTEEKAGETLAAIKKAGYDGIELDGFMIRPTPFLVHMLTKSAGMPTGRGGKLDWKKLMSESGLGVLSIHEDLGRVRNETAAVIEEAREFGTKFIVITGMYRFDYADEASLKKLVSDLNDAGRKLADAGISLLYHNHNVEFVKLPWAADEDGNVPAAYDYLIAHTDPACVNFEFDSYWPTEAGVDALALMKKLGSRQKLYHITDRGNRQSGTAMTPIVKSDCVECGRGNMNLTAMVEQARENGCEAVILESHRNWIDKSPVRSLIVSGQWLAKHV